MRWKTPKLTEWPEVDAEDAMVGSGRGEREGQAEDYPGLVTLPGDFTAPPIEVERPGVFFRKNGPTPERAKLELVPPPGFEEMTTKQFAELLQGKLEARELELRKKHRTEGRTVLGPKAVLDQDPFAYPCSFEPRRNLNTGRIHWHASGMNNS